MAEILHAAPTGLCHGRFARVVLALAGFLFLSIGLLISPSRLQAQTAAPANSQGQNPASKPSDSGYRKYLKELRDVTKYQRKQERKEEIRQSRADNPEGHDDADQYRHAPMVQNIAHHLGLSTETGARIFESLNFLVLLAAIVWFVGRVLPRTLRNRKERIQSEIERARAVTEDANLRLASVEQRLSRLDEEIQAIQTQARKETAAEEQRLRSTLEEEKQRIVAAAEKEVIAAGANAQRELRNLTAELVMEHARRRISVNAETDRRLVDAFVADLPGDRRGGLN